MHNKALEPRLSDQPNILAPIAVPSPPPCTRPTTASTLLRSLHAV